MSVIPCSAWAYIFVIPDYMLLEKEISGVDFMAVLTRVPSVAVIPLHMPIKTDLVGICLAAVWTWKKAAFLQLWFFLRCNFTTKLNFVLIQSGRCQKTFVTIIASKVPVLSVNQLQVLQQQRVIPYSFTAFVAVDLDLHVDNPLVSQQAAAIREGRHALIAGVILYFQVDLFVVIYQVPPDLKGLSALCGKYSSHFHDLTCKFTNEVFIQCKYMRASLLRWVVECFTGSQMGIC